MTRACDLILDAADLRFADYGYRKTTMAEIASDAGMSVGNLYRHFSNKEAIVVACMKRKLQAKLDAGLAAAGRETDALEALRAFLLARLRVGHAQFAGTRHLYELMELGHTRHRDVLLAFEGRVIESIAGILDRGVAQGRFALGDPARTAHDIHQATIRYNYPITLRSNSLASLEGDLERLITLLDVGLAPREGRG